VLALLWRRWGVLGLTIVAVALADWSATGLKALFGRERPPFRYAEPEPLVHTPHDGAFPSGHAATSFAAATILSFAFPRLAPFLFVLAAAVGWSRVYVGVHYPLDIVGGAVYGVLVALALIYLVRRRQRRLKTGFEKSSSGSIGQFRRARG
jgi:membrane-associated phospholipid phosphatase